MQTPIKAQDSANAWYRQYKRLQSYFPEEEAREYAEEITQVAEGRKRETERSPHEIRREMNLLMQIESLIHTTRVLTVIAVGFGLPFLLYQLLSPNGDTLSERIMRPALFLASWVAAGVLWCKRFWKDWLDALRQRRLKCFWEWRSATLRFPTMISAFDSMSSDKSELSPEASEFKKQKPHSPN
jgi:hypothetical protein